MEQQVEKQAIVQTLSIAHISSYANKRVFFVFLSQKSSRNTLFDGT
jgi:hypothetical protein